MSLSLDGPGAICRHAHLVGGDVQKAAHAGVEWLAGADATLSQHSGHSANRHLFTKQKSAQWRLVQSDYSCEKMFFLDSLADFCRKNSETRSLGANSAWALSPIHLPFYRPAESSAVVAAPVPSPLQSLRWFTRRAERIRRACSKRPKGNQQNPSPR